MRSTNRREADSIIIDRRQNNKQVIGQWLDMFREDFQREENEKRAMLKKEYYNV